MEERKYDKIRDNNYIHVEGWMIKRLHLKGNNLLIFACIYGFSQDGASKFTGSMQYLADWTNSSKESVRQCLKYLCDRKLIIKHDVYVGEIKLVEYRANLATIQESCIPMQESCIPIQKSCTNNIDNNIDIIGEEEVNVPVEHVYLEDLSLDKLEELRKILLDNRDTKRFTYRQIQKKFNLVNKVNYDTPEECDRLIAEIKRKSTRRY